MKQVSHVLGADLTAVGAAHEGGNLVEVRRLGEGDCDQVDES
jgi:hypothetical protein